MSTHNMPFISIRKENSHFIITNLHGVSFFLGTQERVRNSRGKRAISVRATEVLLYFLRSVLRYWFALFSQACSSILVRTIFSDLFFDIGSHFFLRPVLLSTIPHVRFA